MIALSCQSCPVLTATGWRSSEHLEAFASSAEGRTYESELTGTCQSVQCTMHVVFPGSNMLIYQHALMDSAAEIHTIEYPKGHRESIAEEFRAVLGMADKVQVGGIRGPSREQIEKRCYNGRPLSGWVVRRTPDETTIDQAVCIHAWLSPERERQYKETKTRTMSGLAPGVIQEEDGADERVWPIEEFFEEQLRRLGALRITKEHFQLQRFPLGLKV